MNERITENKGWSFDTYTYTRDQVEKLVELHLANNQKISATLISADGYLWPIRNYYQFVVEFLERIDGEVIKFKHQFPGRKIDPRVIAAEFFHQPERLSRLTACAPKG